MLEVVKVNIHSAKERVKHAMNYFVYTVGLSYLPLHEKALEIAKEIGAVEVKRENKSTVYNAYNNIQKDIAKGKIGFKRKYVRC